MKTEGLLSHSKKHATGLYSELNESRIAFSGMLRLVALVRTDVSDELSDFFVRVTRIGELGTTLGAKSLRNVGSYKSHTA
jgi:hypothetical protein